MNQTLTYDPTKRRTSPIASSLTDYYQKKMAGGGISDATRAKWTEMDDATGTAASQMRMNQAQPGMFGQGRASRGAAGTDQAIMQQVAANKLKQAQMAGDAQDNTYAQAGAWQNSQDSSDRADRAQMLQTAEAMGDTVTMAGLNRQAIGQGGYGYTDYGERALVSQADQQKEDAAWAKRQQQEAWDLSKRSSELAMKQAKDSYDNDIMNVTKKWSNPTNWFK